MTEKDTFVQRWENESKITLKILRAYPADKGDLKPAEKSKSARELAWMFVMEQGVITEGVVNGKIEFGNLPPAPATMSEVLSAYEGIMSSVPDAVRKMTESDWNSEMDFPVGPKQMGKVRRAAICWMMLMDMIHHRGQFSVYLRIAGAKVPSIYGPSADEPWN